MFEIIWMIFWMDDSTNHLKPAKQTQDVHILCDWSGSNFQHVSTSGTQENSGTQPQTETNHIHRGSYKRLLRNLHRKKWCTKDFKWTSSETKNNGSPWKKKQTRRINPHENWLIPTQKPTGIRCSAHLHWDWPRLIHQPSRSLGIRTWHFPERHLLRVTETWSLGLEKRWQYKSTLLVSILCVGG